MKKYIILILVAFAINQEIFPGYTLFTPGGGGSATTRLIDVNNEIINTWSHSTGPASMPYLVAGDEPGFENTLLYYPCQVPNPTMENGGVGGQVEIYDWDGNLLWEYILADENYQHHHISHNVCCILHTAYCNSVMLSLVFTESCLIL